jgi:hypothetical protein
VTQDPKAVARNRVIDQAFRSGQEAGTNFLRAAYHAHSEAIDRLKAQYAELADLYVKSQPPGVVLPVREARLCNVCRYCRQPQSAPFAFDFGREFAHAGCLKKGDG